MPITTIYGPQAWTAGTFSVTGTDTGDGSYPATNYREDVKTVDAAGPNGERVLDAVTTGDYDTSAHDEVDFGPNAGFFDARGADDGNGVFYEGDVKMSAAAEAVNGDFNYPINVGMGSMSRVFWQLRVALTEGKVYIDVRGDGEEETSASISDDDSWKTFKVQIVPSSDEGSTDDGIVRVWMKDSTDPVDDYVLIYEKTDSFAWVNTTGDPFMVNFLAYGHYGVLPVTNWHIYYGEDAATVTGTSVLGEGGTVAGLSRVHLLNLDGVTRTISQSALEGSAVIGGNLTLIEQAAPPAGVANMARIFAVDDGSGKTRLMVQFGTGAAIEIAVEA